ADLARSYANATSAQRETRAQARRTIKSAIASYNKAEWMQAIDLFSKGRLLFKQSDDEGEMLAAEAFVGYCYLRIPDPENGLHTFQHLSKIFETKDYRTLFAQSLLALADAMNGRNEFSKVLAHA